MVYTMVNSIEKTYHSYTEEELTRKCITYSNIQNIGTISNETLKKCLQIPNIGIRVKDFYFENCYYPVINLICDINVAVNRIGKYCINKGKIVFVYRDGKTYVAKAEYGIISELSAAGYKEYGMFVPFSNGEKIIDPILRARWESILNK